jgi:hypothetical protein
MQLLRRPGFEDGETCQGKSVSASLTDLASRDPANFAQVHGTRCGAQCTGRHVWTRAAEGSHIPTLPDDPD